jgi:hypothetical protein
MKAIIHDARVSVMLGFDKLQQVIPLIFFPESERSEYKRIYFHHVLSAGYKASLNSLSHTAGGQEKR